MSATIAERVAAGAAWLDQHQPGWVDRIDLDRLYLASTCHCILGQLDEDGYHQACHRLGIEPGTQAFELGFNTMISYAALTAAWRDLIRQRRAEQ